jgi:glucokinase
MNKNIVIGVDVGGSHITSAAIDLDKLEIVSGTTHSNKIDNKAKKEVIFKNWSTVINQTIKSVPLVEEINIGIAMPGPFNYKTGLAIFENNDKYENLFNVSIPNEFSSYIEASAVKFRFLNDATSFGVGASCMGEAKNKNKIIAITLGTGFGSCFINKGIPQVNAKGIPEGGCLWDKPFKDGIADDYFSTRWFKKRYFEISEEKVKGVKEIAQKNDLNSKIVFQEFSSNLANFMTPFIQVYQPDLIILGGNVSNASNYFLPGLKNQLIEKGLKTDFVISNLMEEAALIGSARLFDPVFWNKVKNDLPNF